MADALDLLACDQCGSAVFFKDGKRHMEWHQTLIDTIQEWVMAEIETAQSGRP